jgi:hypothetical protein
LPVSLATFCTTSFVVFPVERCTAFVYSVFLSELAPPLLTLFSDQSSLPALLS